MLGLNLCALSLTPSLRFTGKEKTLEAFTTLINALIDKFKQKAPPTLLLSKPPIENELAPLIFLDFDGVCWPDDSARDNPEVLALSNDKKLYNYLLSQEEFLKKHYDSNAHEFLRLSCWNPAHIERITTLCEKFKAKIVVTSNWRGGRTVKHLQNLLDLWGLGHYVIDKLPDNRGIYQCRSIQIETWLQRNKHLPGNFVILEDGYVQNMKTQFPEHFVQCFSDIGFDETAFLKASAILEKHNPEVVAVASKKSHTP